MFVSGSMLEYGSPSSQKLLLQTGRLQQQTEFIAMI